MRKELLHTQQQSREAVDKAESQSRQALERAHHLEAALAVCKEEVRLGTEQLEDTRRQHQQQLDQNKQRVSHSYAMEPILKDHTPVFIQMWSFKQVVFCDRFSNIEI